MSKAILNIMVVLFCFLLTGGVAKAQSFEHPGGLHTRSQIETARKKIAAREQPWIGAYEALIGEAKKNLKRPAQAVKNFSVPGYYSDAKGHREAMKRLSGDAWAAYSCGVAYQLTTGKERVQYAEKAVQVLSAWATINTRTGGADGNLAMADAGTGLVFAAELMTDYDGWKKEQRAEFAKWVRNVYLKSCESIVRRANNWGDWGLLGCIASHHFLNDAKGLDADIKRIRQRIDHLIAADGHMPGEAKRGKNGIWYTYFALAPLTAVCQIAENARGVDLFHYKGKDGAGIEKALDYMLRYCHKPSTWPHYRKKGLTLPRQKSWPGNLYEAMSGIYGKKEYAAWIKDARPIMVYGHHYAWAVPALLRTVPPQKKPDKGGRQ